MTSAIKILLLSLLLASCSGIRIDRAFRAGPNDWTLYGGSPARANIAAVSLKPPFEEVWEYNALAGIAASPLVRDSMVVIATLNSEIQVVNLTTGKRLGYVALESAIAGTPALDGDGAIVPVAGGDVTLVSLSLRNSSERNWSIDLGPIESSPLLFDDAVYVTTMEGIAYCLKKKDGSEVWKYATGTDERRTPQRGTPPWGKPVRSSPATDGQSIFFGSDDGNLYALEKASGSLKWKFNAGAPMFSTPVVSGKNVFVGTLGGVFYCIDASTGAMRWQYDAGAPIYGSAAANAQTAFVGASDGSCHAIDLATGKRVWKFQTKSGVNSAPLVAGELLYWGSMDRTLYVLDAQSGNEIWKYDALGRIKVPPVIWGEFLLVTSEDKYIVALRPTL